MLVLGIDTATLVCGVALITPQRLLAEYTLQVRKTHSEQLLPLVAAMLRDAGLTPAELGGVAVAAGPGSFTGVRIGVATARALGQALGLPLVAVSTLEALAAQLPHFPGLVSPILDARRQQVYNAVFRVPEDGLLRLREERAIPLPELLAELQAYGEPVLFTGDAVPVYRELITEALSSQACFLPLEAGLSRAASVARLGLTRLMAGGGVPYQELLPLYVRRSEAETKCQADCREGGLFTGTAFGTHATGTRGPGGGH